jgi:4-alpha-glucanotransferase
VCDLLLAGGEGGAAGSPPRPIDDVVLLRDGKLVSGVATTFERPLPIEVTLDDGSTAGLGTAGSRSELQRALTAADLPIGIHRLGWAAGDLDDHRATLLVAPRRFPVPGRRGPGLALFTPAYALWTEAEPLPSYHGLAELGRAVAGLGVDTIATLPLYAPGLGASFQASPYSPVSRFHWNELLVPDADLGTPAPGSSDGFYDWSAATIDWSFVEADRRAQLDHRVRNLTDAEQADVDLFLAGRPDVVSYARFCAGGDDDLARIHEVGQWLAERGLSTLTDRLAADGLQLALDLPVGARVDSWETATHPTLFTAGATIGAPPDFFFSSGQNWGLPPLSPTGSRADGHRVWHDLIDTACRFAGYLRIDHVMQVHRLWWIPDGHPADDGVYVQYPADELLAVAAIVAHRTGTTMVGENLGTVPPAVVDLLDDWALPGMYEEIFTLHDHLDPARRAEALGPVPPGSWAGVRTHDMPALAKLVTEIDATSYARKLAAAVGHPVEVRPRQLLMAMMERLRGSDALEVVVDLDDALGVTAAHNVPGTVADSNWSRRLDVAADALAADDRLTELLDG